MSQHRKKKEKIPHCPQSFFFTRDRRDLSDNHCSDMQGNEGVRSSSLAKSIFPKCQTHMNACTHTNIPAWHIPPSPGGDDAGPERQNCWRSLARGEKESVQRGERRKTERNEKTNTETPGDSEPQSIPNQLAADLQIQYSHLVYTRSTVRCTQTNQGRQRETFRWGWTG